MNNRNVILNLLAMAAFALSPIAQAVVPPPDGGYPGGNTAEGQNALLALTSGTFNTAVGWFALRSDTTGPFNTALGAGTLFANTGEQNTATGAGALLNNTSAAQNTADGTFALLNNTVGFGNTAVGDAALRNNISGASNTATGIFALFSNISGVDNTAMGSNALLSNGIGNNNTAIGVGALANNHSGSNNIALGAGAGSNVVIASGTICIGIAGVDVNDGCYIGHVFEELLDPDNLAMAIDVNGKVGTLPSSRRFKDDVQPMDKTSEAILALKPVTFHYKNDKNCSPRFGLIAEEVADVNPNLVARDKDGKPFSVRYDQVNAMLLNEFLKEHGKVQELEKGMVALTAQLKEQAAQIQKVSALIQMNKPATKVALDNP